MRTVLSWMCLVIVMASGSAQVTKSGAGYLFRAKYAKGQKMTYAMNVSMPMGGPSGTNVASPIVMLVKSVAKGIATVDVTTGPVVMNGAKQGKAQKQTVQLNARNQSVGKLSSTYQAMASFAFPEKPIAVGKSWEGDMAMGSPMSGNIKMKAKYTFLGLKMLGGKQVAEVKTSFSGNAMGKVSGNGVTRILCSDGSLHSANATMELVIQLDPKGGKDMPIKSTVSIVRK